MAKRIRREIKQTHTYRYSVSEAASQVSSRAVRWRPAVRALHFYVGGTGPLPSQGAKILHEAWPKKIKPTNQLKRKTTGKLVIHMEKKIVLTHYVRSKFPVN